MYSILLWMLRLSCSISRVDSDCVHQTPMVHEVITPECFGY